MQEVTIRWPRADIMEIEVPAGTRRFEQVPDSNETDAWREIFQQGDEEDFGMSMSLDAFQATLYAIAVTAPSIQSGWEVEERERVERVARSGGDGAMER